MCIALTSHWPYTRHRSLEWCRGKSGAQPSYNGNQCDEEPWDTDTDRIQLASNWCLRLCHSYPCPVIETVNHLLIHYTIYFVLTSNCNHFFHFSSSRLRYCRPEIIHLWLTFIYLWLNGCTHSKMLFAFTSGPVGDSLEEWIIGFIDSIMHSIRKSAPFVG